MPVTRSDLVIFSTGLAVGAVAYATYPKWKGKVGPLFSEAHEKLSPLVATAVAAAGAAFADAKAASDQAAAPQPDSQSEPATPTQAGSASREATPTAAVPV